LYALLVVQVVSLRGVVGCKVEVVGTGSHDIYRSTALGKSAVRKSFATCGVIERLFADGETCVGGGRRKEM
jgi:hypothetical protein